ncbi:hypothetical protein GCM10010399_52430 [Dactylosporangium fulvum]|uniref:Uncharacterized protein n=1 Tax=Dactylosporangium fulvum TaxID=53359 RepID=A0ABY5WBH0_9ACTN|nr:hypothetical protein [Dactylosporangium fulvum]UWP86369.1 hypothetical protein Dfulv_19860 [Dactylosporangium fulvum]
MQRKPAAVALALSVLALLIGLSHAHHALPGDTFQVARATHAAVTITADLDHQPAAVEQPAVTVGPDTTGTTAAPTAPHVHCGRSIGTPGCRGPPTS